jgi:VWFA-related protein
VAVTRTHWAPIVFIGIFSIFISSTALAAGDGIDQPRVSIEPKAPSRIRTDIRVESNLVLLPVHVTDSKNRVVTGLAAGEFRVFDGRSEQRVLHLSNDDAPLSMGIVFDCSGSMARNLNKAREAVTEFLKSAAPEDEFFLVNFNNRANLAVPFTHNAGDIEDRLRSQAGQGKTALVDAVYLALEQMRRAANPRKALLIISDGGDNDSRYSPAELKRALRESNVWIYAIGIYSSATPVLPEEEMGGPKLLTDIAEETGGRHIPVFRRAELPDAAAQIGRELRHQYILAYSPASLERDGKYHRVQVTVVGRRDLRLAWRRGYYAPAD